MCALGLGVAEAAEVGWGSDSRALRGQGWPVFWAQSDVDATAKLTLRCAGLSFDRTLTLSAGRRATLELVGLPEGVTTCEGTMQVQASDGMSGGLDVQVDVASLGIIGLTSALERFDFDAGTLTVSASRGLSFASARVEGPGGVPTLEVDADLSRPTEPLFRWGAAFGEVVKVVVTARDAAGFLSTLELLPWFLEIPHEDVIFPSGSDAIPAEEVGKLEAAWGAVAAAVQKYGRQVPVKLYVAGYTDTVGATTTNQSLSDRRARALAQWFRSRGFGGELYYQGFGERALAVPTGDEVDEAANRRALYVLAADRPPTSPSMPATAWKRL